LSANISGTDEDSDKNLNGVDEHELLGVEQKIFLRNSVHYEQSYKRSCRPTLSRQCTLGVYQCIWVRATWLWWRGNFTPLNFPKSDLGRTHIGLCPKFLVFFYFAIVSQRSINRLSWNIATRS